jgi:hypothetical protein
VELADRRERAQERHDPVPDERIQGHHVLALVSFESTTCLDTWDPRDGRYRHKGEER